MTTTETTPDSTAHAPWCTEHEAEADECASTPIQAGSAWVWLVQHRLEDDEPTVIVDAPNGVLTLEQAGDLRDAVEQLRQAAIAVVGVSKDTVHRDLSAGVSDETPAPDSDPTDDRGSRQCEARAWCDVPGPSHEGEHRGEADLPKITATGYREDFISHDDGVVVPEVFAELVEHEDSNTFERQTVQLTIVRPDERTATAYLTMKEAQLLQKALVHLLAEPGHDRAAGLA